MQFGLMAIALLIANLHAAVFYVFFVLMLPYFAEYIIVVIRNSYFMHRLKIFRLKQKIQILIKEEKGQEEIEKVQSKLMAAEEKFEKFKEISRKREENPYKIKLVKRDAVKWLFLVAILCFVMGLLTPIGNEPYTHIFKLLSGTTTGSISEHQPLVLWTHIAAITVFCIILAFLIFTNTKISLKDGFMLAGLILLTFSSRRQFSLLLIIGVMSLTKLISDLKKSLYSCASSFTLCNISTLS